MPKPPIKTEYVHVQQHLIKVMREGLRQWRPDLDGPESFSDWEAVARAIIRVYELNQRPFSLTAEEIEDW